jgi:hypothetical protein
MKAPRRSSAAPLARSQAILTRLSQSIEITQIYFDADLELKQRILRLGHTSQRKARAVSTRRQASRLPQKPVTHGLCLGHLAVRTDDEPRHRATGHSPTREIVDLRMTEQDLHGAQVARLLIDDGSLGSAERVRPVVLPAQPNPGTHSSTRRAYCRVLI